MKYIILLALTLLVRTSTFAEGKNLKLTNKGCCAKCCLKIADKCEDVLTVTGKDGKKTRCYVMSPTIKGAHKKFFCVGIKGLTVAGTCRQQD